ncbi:MAG: diaminopimelate epimerase [Chitinophagales bacterium]|nr:diaminopimelate epimerase [Chitinophagales bacterium]
MLQTFAKYQGTGNDFIIIDNRNLIFNKNTLLIQQLCDRKFGIGADGLMLIENDDHYDFKMVYYNADGNESTMCGNGGRCIAHYAFQLGITTNKGKFIAIDGEHDFEIKADGAVKLKMIDVNKIDKDGDAFVLFTGSPHFVLMKDNITIDDFVAQAKAIRYNDTYAKEGINVNFINTNDIDNISMRTYERGVEDETLSCGTGTVAVALTVASIKAINAGSLPIQTPGGELRVYFTQNNHQFSDIWLEGPAVNVFNGKIEL